MVHNFVIRKDGDAIQNFVTISLSMFDWYWAIVKHRNKDSKLFSIFYTGNVLANMCESIYYVSYVIIHQVIISLYFK